MVTGGATVGAPVVDMVSSAELRAGRASPCSDVEIAGGVREIVGCGRPGARHHAAHRRPRDVPRAARGRGRRDSGCRAEAWRGGISATRRARSRPSAGCSPTLRPRSSTSGTGDLGYVRGGELFVVWTREGRRHRSRDEPPRRRPRAHGRGGSSLGARGQRRGLRVGRWRTRRGARHRRGGRERRRRGARAGGGEAIDSAIAQAHQVEVIELALVRHGVVPRTSSGKLMRAACRDALSAGTLPTRWRWSSVA